MAHYWLLMSFSWIGSASLQYISSAYEDQIGPTGNSILNSLDSAVNHPLLSPDYFNLPQLPANLDMHQREPTMLDVLFPEIFQPPSVRMKRAPEIEENEVMPSSFSNFADTDVPALISSDTRINSSPIIIQDVQDEGYTGTIGNNGSYSDRKVKRSFSPWGGKRDVLSNTWTWKRAAAMREPSMPKRVRFSPWGGKRSSQLVFKPGNKASRIIFSRSFPELMRIISTYSPRGSINVADFQMVPSKDKRNPIRILALSSKLEGSRDALPFRAFIKSTKMYKSGHSDSDVNLRKDDKRKVKFSAWGGKRSPPIIGPIWSPSSQTIQDHTLDTILLIRKDEVENDKRTKAI